MTTKIVLLVLGVMAFLAPLAKAYPPYYDISQTEAAKAEAQARHLPIAYLGSFPECLTEPSPNPDSWGDLTQMALSALQGKAVVIFFDGHNMTVVPALIHAQYHIHDDGPLPDGAAWNIPKIVFADPAITKPLGRVSRTQMAAGREAPIEAALAAIQNDPTSLQRRIPHPPPAWATAADLQAMHGQSPAPDTETPSDNETQPQPGTVEWAKSIVIARWQYFAAAGAIFVIALIARAVRRS